MIIYHAAFVDRVTLARRLKVRGRIQNSVKNQKWINLPK